MGAKGAAPGEVLGGTPGQRQIERESNATLPRIDCTPRSKLPTDHAQRRFVA